MRNALRAGAAATLLFGLAACGNDLGDEADQSFQDIRYGTVSGSQALDLYLPEGEGPFPLIAYVHGGGFMMGSKRGGEVGEILSAALERGYAVASIGYRLSGEAPFPAAADDVLAAVRFLKAEAATYNLAPERMASWGGSAGGNLASMIATKGGAADGTAVQAAVNWFGPIRFDQMDAQFEALDLTPALGPTSGPSSPESRYLGQVVGGPDAAELVRRASPQSYITPDDPPMLIQHGTMDRNVPILQSETFAAALARVIGEENVVYTPLEGAGHGGAAFESEANLDRVFRFLDAHLKD